jgi:hypothetical protein
MLQQMDTMLAAMAAQLQAGPMTPEQTQQLREMVGQLAGMVQQLAGMTGAGPVVAGGQGGGMRGR